MHHQSDFLSSIAEAVQKLIRSLSCWSCSSHVQHLLRDASLHVFRGEQYLPKGVYIEVIAPKRTKKKKRRPRVIEIFDSVGLSRQRI